jgi:hypothetical protein
MQRTWESYFRFDGHRKKMTFDDKRRLMQHLLSGKTPDGKRAGIFITYNKSSRRPWQYVIKGTVRLDGLGGHFKCANVNLIGKDHPGNGEDTGYHRP